MHDIANFLWFDTEAEDAAAHYVAIFDDAKITNIRHYGDTGPGERGGVMTVDFELGGHPFIALNGGAGDRFNESVSFMIVCESQDEVDHYWRKLSTGGEEGPCGWLKDKYGLSWQVVPKLMFELLDDPDPIKSQAAMAAMLQMGKIESKQLLDAVGRAQAPLSKAPAGVAGEHE